MGPTEIKKYFKNACKDVDNGRSHIYPALQSFSQMIKTLQNCNLDIHVDIYNVPSTNAFALVRDVTGYTQQSLAISGLLHFGRTSCLFALAHQIMDEDTALLTISDRETSQHKNGTKFTGHAFDLMDQDELAVLQEHLINMCAREKQLIKNNDVGDVFNKPAGHQHPRARTAISEIKKPALTSKTPAPKTTRP
ncbi:MAG: hypothetical protein ACQEQL_06580 [Pseudomonadota bacterium]